MIELECRRCGMVASLDVIRALLDERVKGLARCFCESIEWDEAGKVVSG